MRFKKVATIGPKKQRGFVETTIRTWLCEGDPLMSGLSSKQRENQKRLKADSDKRLSDKAESILKELQQQKKMNCSARLNSHRKKRHRTG